MKMQLLSLVVHGRPPMRMRPAQERRPEKKEMGLEMGLERQEMDLELQEMDLEIRLAEQEMGLEMGLERGLERGLGGG